MSRHRATPSSSPLAVLLRQCEPAFLRQVRRRVHRILGSSSWNIPMADREDLEQEIVVQLWRLVNRPGFDDGPGFWKLLEVITCRRVIDWRRAYRSSGLVEEETPDLRPGPLGSLLNTERWSLARKALEGLGLPCRELVTLHVAEQKSSATIGAVLGKREGALPIQMYRCVQRATIPSEFHPELDTGFRAAARMC